MNQANTRTESSQKEQARPVRLLYCSLIPFFCALIMFNAVTLATTKDNFSSTAFGYFKSNWEYWYPCRYVFSKIMILARLETRSKTGQGKSSCVGGSILGRFSVSRGISRSPKMFQSVQGYFMVCSLTSKLPREIALITLTSYSIL
jgi:hypothetical protein